MSLGVLDVWTSSTGNLLATIEQNQTVLYFPYIYCRYIKDTMHIVWKYNIEWNTFSSSYPEPECNVEELESGLFWIH